jgi:uncharacterized phage-like protein YoqJ
MRIAFTGHRPDKLGGYKTPNRIYDRVIDKLHFKLTELRPRLTAAISGMAVGVDQWAAEIALDLDLPLIAAIPFRGQESGWPPAAQEKYRALMGRASEIVVVSEGGYEPWKMQRRNEWMVDNSDILLAVWNWSPGGTCNCIKYAQRISKDRPYERVFINPNEE